MEAFLEGRRFAVENGEERALLFQPAGLQQGPDAYFGFWESSSIADSDAVLERLESEARAWGCRRLTGPIQGSTVASHRLRLDENPSTGWRLPAEPQNSRAQVDRLIARGWKESARYSSFRVGFAAADAWFEKLMRGPYYTPTTGEVRSIDAGFVRRYEDSLVPLVNEAFRANPAFAPITVGDFRTFFDERALSRLSPGGSFAIMGADGAPGAFLISYELQWGERRALAAKTVVVDAALAKSGVNMLSLLGILKQRVRHVDDIWMCFMKAGNFPYLLTKEIAEETRHYALFSKEL